MRVLIAVTHLLGAGHLTRAAALARALAAAGHETVLASGGAPASLVRLDGVRLLQLPPLHVRGTAFNDLRDADGAPASGDLLARRRRMLLDTLAAFAPEAVVTELFPFGRRALAPEFLALAEAAHARRPRPLVLASIRDVLVAPEKPERVGQAHARLAALYDAVLVHGDARLVPLGASWPVDGPAPGAGLAPMLRETGYVDEGAADPAPGPRAGILVSAGSSAAGLGLLAAAAGAARARPELGWRILAGGGVPEADFAALGAGLGAGVLERARPDYRALLARAAVSVSACGYNTAVDLLAAGTRAVLVPFEGGRETEQRLRAERMAALGLARVLPEADLAGGTLLAAVEAALAAPEPPPHGIARDGAARSVRLIADLVRQRRAAPGLARIRAALDARPSPVTLWWRDDDAVADTLALARLLALAAGTPLLLAAIPAGIEPSLGRRLAGAPNVSVAIHGLAHADHAPPGAKPAEFGPHRPLPARVADAGEALRLARARLADLPQDRVLPVFVPPWNRLAADLAAALPGLGYRGLSAVAGPPVPGLVRADIDIDPIDWRGTRSLIDPERLAEAVAARIAAGGPIGLLTHHLAHDAALWTWLEDLLGLLIGHPAVTVADPRHLFAPEAVDAAATPWWTARESARVS